MTHFGDRKFEKMGSLFGGNFVESTAVTVRVIMFWNTGNDRVNSSE